MEPQPNTFLLIHYSNNGTGSFYISARSSRFCYSHCDFLLLLLADRDRIDLALLELKAKGELDKLEIKWWRVGKGECDPLGHVRIHCSIGFMVAIFNIEFDKHGVSSVFENIIEGENVNSFLPMYLAVENIWAIFLGKV